jgi:hypothetical protein
VTDPLPSAWLAGRAVACAGETEALRALTAPTFRPEETALVEGLSPAQAEHLGGGGGVVRLMTEQPERLEWDVDAPSASFLVLNMAYNPHWRAQVAAEGNDPMKGRPVPVYRTNYMQCGVTIPAGRSRVVAVYRDDEFRQGLRITVFTAVALAGLLLVLGAVEGAERRRAPKSS